MAASSGQFDPSDIERLVDDLLAGRLPPTPGEPAWVRKLRACTAQRDAQQLQAEQARQTLERVTVTLMRLAALDFSELPQPELTGDDVLDAAHYGLSMMAEELTASQQALKNARDEAIAANRSKSSFLASMSHELRTPLNAIIGYCELASEDLAVDPEEVEQDLKRIRNAASHLLGLISDILDLSKIEAGRMEVAMEMVEIAPLVCEVVEAVRHLADSNGDQIQLDLADARKVWADPVRLRQVLFNLVGNAAKYTANGRIEVRTIPTDDDIAWIEVRDTGVGIAPDQLQRIFQPFYRIVEHGGPPGTGLGLAITERLCRMMRGEVEAQSTLGAGSTFRVRLSTRPLAPCDLEDLCPAP